MDAELAELGRRMAEVVHGIGTMRAQLAAAERELEQLSLAVAAAVAREQEWARREEVVDQVMEEHVRSVRAGPWINERDPADRAAPRHVWSGDNRERL